MNEEASKPNLNETDWLELALRLAISSGDPHTQNVRLLPGQLPDLLPGDIPFPEGSRVLASLIRDPESIDIFLDTSLSPRQVLAFYRQCMPSAGWQAPDMYRPDRGGFISYGSRNRGGVVTFYQDPHGSALTFNASESSSVLNDDGDRRRRGTTLTVNAFTSRDNGTDLRLNLQMDRPLPPDQPMFPHRRGRHRDLFSRLPALEAPEGANQIGGGGSGSQNGVQTEVTLVTTHDLSTLAAHYRGQLEQARCVLTAEGQSGPLAWNSWTMEEDNELWYGFLIILKVLDQEYHLTMRMRGDDGGKTAPENPVS